MKKENDKIQSKTTDKQSNSTEKAKKQFPKWLGWVGGLVLIVGIGAAWSFYKDYQQKSLLGQSAETGIYHGLSHNHNVMLNPSSYRLREKKPVLNPMQFQFEKQIAAYEAARKYPEVLDQLYCYCACDKSIGHKSLLSCFADNHASMCGVCMDEALLAQEMTLNGKPVNEIADAIDKTYGGF
ncbi:CYCXC family (seleno)protein [Deltaproteobacteria bacterium TL4]